MRIFKITHYEVNMIKLSCCGNAQKREKNIDPCCSGAASCSCDNIPKFKMCQMTQPANSFDIEKVKSLTNDAKYVCSCCGRTANNKDNLCSPVNLF